MDYDGKYRPLTRHLEGVADPVVCMTFEEIEQVLGFHLPQSARSHPAWWANQGKGQSLAWRSVGFKTQAVTTDEERLTFIRDDAPGEREPEIEPLSIAEAKERLAFTLGISPSQVEITIRA